MTGIIIAGIYIIAIGLMAGHALDKARQLDERLKRLEKAKGESDV